MITIQKVTGTVQTVPRQSPDIYWHAELCILWWASSNHQLCGDCNRQQHRDVLINLCIMWNQNSMNINCTIQTNQMNIF